MSASPAAMDITDAQFGKISALVHELAGINLHDGKKELVRARLAKRLRALQMRGFDDYLRHLREDGGDELVAMLDALSTNLTSFFREADHFEYLTAQLLPTLSSRRLRLWSAGCSSGEEPYTIAIALAEALPDLGQWDTKILATDLSTKVLQRARAGVYEAARLSDLPEPLRVRHFRSCPSDRGLCYEVKPHLRDLIAFARLNLMDPWPMRGPFHAIFCRNVMIYFDKPTQARLIDRFGQLLGSGGVLFIGHSESLSGIRHQFQYVQPTVYRKP